MKNVRLVFSIIGIILSSYVYSQTAYVINEKLMSNVEDRNLFDKAESFLQNNDFADALPYYQKLSLKYPDDGLINYRMGICFLSRSDMPEKSLAYFRKAEELKFFVPGFDFDYGRALHLNYLFGDAQARFQSFLDSRPDKKMEAKARLYIEYCRNAKELMALPSDVTIKNIGKDINSAGAQYGPVISSDEVFLIFTYRWPRSTGGLQSVYTDYTIAPDSSKQYYEDIFYSYKIGSHWLRSEEHTS